MATNNMSKSNFVFYINNCLTFIAFQAAKQSWTISGRGSRGIHMNLFIKYTNYNVGGMGDGNLRFETMNVESADRVDPWYLYVLVLVMHWLQYFSNK